MGKPDQLLKYMFELEAPGITRKAVSFRVAPEIATTELVPDGLLIASMPEVLQSLPFPWPLLVKEAVLDGKMPGDHLDPLALERCLWRRHARQIQRIEKESADPWPSECALWIVAPYNPEWFAEWEALGHLRLEAVAPGVTKLHPSLYPIVWIAANDLPLHEALIPFLLPRTGRKLKEFVRWVVHVRPPEWIARVVQSHPEVAAMLPDFKPDLSPEDKLRVIEGLRKSIDAYPEAGVDVLKRGTKHGLGPLVCQFERRLGRSLEPVEKQTIEARLDTVGAKRLGDVVFDLKAEELAAWLGDPNAC